MTEPTFLVVDVETLDEAPPAGLIELGWTSLRHDPQACDETSDYVFGEVEGSVLFGIPPGQRMTAFNRSIHHIDPDLLEGLDPFCGEWLLGTRAGFDMQGVGYVVAHNAAFEAQWLDFGVPWVCTYKCALHAWPDLEKHTNQALKYELGMPDHPDLHPPHRALPDARVTAFILARLLQDHSVEQLVQWSAEPRPIRKMPFGKHSGALLVDVPVGYLEWVSGPGCEAADADLKYACRREVERRRAPRPEEPPTVGEELAYARFEQGEGDR